eukprot:4677726-Prymnesium_polylepis.2
MASDSLGSSTCTTARAARPQSERSVWRRNRRGSRVAQGRMPWWHNARAGTCARWHRKPCWHTRAWRTTVHGGTGAWWHEDRSACMVARGFHGGTVRHAPSSSWLRTRARPPRTAPRSTSASPGRTAAA